MSEDKKAISKLYNGEYYFAEKPVPRTAEYMTSVRKINEYTKELSEILNDEQSNLLEKLLDETGRMNGMLHEHYFEEGFSVATQLIFGGLKK